MDTGIETSGGSLNWRNIISNRDEDPIVSALMKHALNIFVNANDKEVPEKKYNLNDIYIKEINKFFKSKNLPTIFDVIIDLRNNSSTYMRWESFELSDENKNSIFIPPGCANAFLTLSSDCLIHYYCSKSYEPNSELGVRFNDPSFNIIWPHKPEVISEKDLSHPDYKA